MMLVWDSLGDSESTVNQTESYWIHFLSVQPPFCWWQDHHFWWWNHLFWWIFFRTHWRSWKSTRSRWRIAPWGAHLLEIFICFGDVPAMISHVYLEDYPISTHTVALIHCVWSMFFCWFHRDTLKKIAIFWMATRWSRGFCSNISRQSHFWTCFEKPHGYISECILCWLIAPRKCCLVSFKIIQGNKACQSWRVLSSLVVLSLAVLQWPVCIDTILQVDQLPLTGNVPQG